MPASALIGRTPLSGNPTVSRPPSSARSPGMAPGGSGAPPGGVNTRPVFVRTPPSALRGNPVPRAIAIPTAVGVGAAAAPETVAAVAGGGAAAVGLAPAAVIAVGGIAAILGTAAGSQAIAGALMPINQGSLSQVPITSPAGGVQANAFYRATISKGVWFQNNRSDYSLSQSVVFGNGVTIGNNIAATISSLPYGQANGSRKEEALSVAVTLETPGTGPFIQPDFSAIPATQRNGAFAPPLAIGLDGLPQPSIAPDFIPTIAPPKLAPPPVLPPLQPQMPGVDPVKVPDYIPNYEPDPPWSPLPPAATAPTPNKNRPKLPTPLNPPIEDELVSDDGYYEPPDPLPPTFPELPTHRPRTTENCCIDPPPKQEDCCEEILEELEKIKECACDEQKFDDRTLLLGGGDSLTAALPALTRRVRVSVTGITNNVRNQSGGSSSPSVYFVGWYAFGKGNSWGDRKPISYESNVFPCPEGYDKFLYTLVFGASATAIAEYQVEVDN